MKKSILIGVVAMSLAGCYEQAPTGQACLGADNDSLVEGLGGVCKKGDIVATKNPAHFCDFNYSVTFNGYNSAFCVYVGEQRESRSK
ncbi:hypothetical protein SAMN05421672_102260 [Pseudomonas flexibilis]|uniref:Lipoprotein n=1 Tax=Pseudomonas flexibilis TaxID=706570 RepID=A0A1N6PQT1_9PSED|nr:hypothetical protein SAMN05421672_102260 [Pseudomonas flexibilis]